MTDSDEHPQLLRLRRGCILGQTVRAVRLRLPNTGMSFWYPKSMISNEGGVIVLRLSDTMTVRLGPDIPVRQATGKRSARGKAGWPGGHRRTAFRKAGVQKARGRKEAACREVRYPRPSLPCYAFWPGAHDVCQHLHLAATPLEDGWRDQSISGPLCEGLAHVRAKPAARCVDGLSGGG